jgi:hypothetical protein
MREEGEKVGVVERVMVQYRGVIDCHAIDDIARFPAGD